MAAGAYRVLSKERKVNHAALAIDDVLKGGLKRVHGLSALDKMGDTPPERLKLLKTTGYLDVILHTILHARSDTQQSVRARSLAIQCMFRHILDNPKIDELILSHPNCVPAILSVLDDMASVDDCVLVATALDFFAVTPSLRPILVFHDDFLDRIIPHMNSPLDEVRMHLVRMMNYVTQDSRVLFTVARHEQLIEALCGTCVMLDDDADAPLPEEDDPEELAELLADLEDEEIQQQAADAGVTMKEFILGPSESSLFGRKEVAEAPTVESYALNCLLNIARLPANIRLLQANDLLLAVVMEFSQKAKSLVDRDIAGQIIDLLTPDEDEDPEGV
ncbi:hypothetical protein J8273_3204 [Carpediemonas membranifera]|uniref:Uncharacterized protein n=1 Tax=Carpediemonas membranifera TaxID=201153 RepID=A0A8J6AW64_9EUKA|nr:hypothetical protein J8273_3204 [Carpediemonas membranifera]|eukprot:KAG9393075.1 hypothetical protein J8273_3204 [Carpediemonas membranifera]